MAINYKEMWAVLWSKSQDAFHVETLDETMFENWDVFYGINPNDSDWILMAVVDSIKEANQLSEHFKRKKLHYLATGELPDKTLDTP